MIPRHRTLFWAALAIPDQLVPYALWLVPCCFMWAKRGLLLRRRTLDGDACCPHEGGCPPQLPQVAIQLVLQKRRVRPCVPPYSIIQSTVLQ